MSVLEHHDVGIYEPQPPCSHCQTPDNVDFPKGCPKRHNYEGMVKCPVKRCRCKGLPEQGGLCESCYFDTK